MKHHVNILISALMVLFAVSLAADIEWVGEGLDPNRKACLIIRQSLDTSAAYVDAAVHGDGLTSIQYRDMQGGQGNGQAFRGTGDHQCSLLVAFSDNYL